MNNRKGSLTIEASIALTAFIFLVVTVLGFGRLYQAQSLISHAAIQTSQSLAIETYYRETISSNDTLGTVTKLINFANALSIPIPSGIDDGYASLGDSGTALLPIIRETFAYAIAETSDEADKKLEKLGVVDGLDGLNFASSAVKDGEVIVFVRYKAKMPFDFFGKIEVELTKAAKSKTFKKAEKNNVVAGTNSESSSGSGEGGGFSDGGGEGGGSSGGGFR